MPLTNWSAAITVLLTAGVIFSALRYSRASLTLSAKVILIALRTAWIIGLVLSFWEPVIRFERFESGRMKIPVLIDASLSMQNFSPTEQIAPFLDTLSSLQSRTGGRVGFEYFLFGDSTRINKSNAASAFGDSKSFFPAALDEQGGRFANDMIIISDGHWTKPRRSSEIFPRNAIHYLVLPEAHPNPFVTISCDAPETAPSDSSFTVNITAIGFVQECGTLKLSLKEKNRTVKTEAVEIEQGYFTHTVRFKTANSRPGRKLYTAEAVIDSAIPPSASSFVHQTIPHFLTYSMYSAKPTLDRRYVAQALASNRFFREKASSPDILFLFDWDSAAAQLTRGLPRHAAAVFAGCLPCSSNGIAAPSISVKQTDNSAFSTNLDLRSMPPPEAIITCKQLPVSGVKRLINAAVNTGGSNSENAMILFSGRFKGTQSLFCPVRGIWRWDFWPMSTDRAENELFNFSNTLLSLAKELLFDNIADQLILYPAGTLYETDSAKFMMSLPAAVPVFEPVKLSVQIQNDDTVIDTVLAYHPNGLNRQPISFPALPQGRYAISAALKNGAINAAFADSFTVNKDMSELSVLAQNTQYLQEFASPIDMRDTLGMTHTFDSWIQRSAEKNTVTETVRINRNWLLLGIVLLLFAVELILRRKWGVD